MIDKENDAKQINTPYDSCSDNSYDGFRSLRKEALELFGPMREATKEEIDSVRQYIDSISVDTGINIFNVLDEKEKHDNPY